MTPQRRTGTRNDWHHILEWVRLHDAEAADRLESAAFLRAEVDRDWLLIVLEWDPTLATAPHTGGRALHWAARACAELYRVQLEIECRPPEHAVINCRFRGAA